MKAFGTMKKYYAERDLAAREWKRKGGKVAGYFCTNTPIEIIYASGALPVRIVGDPEEEVTLGDGNIEEICCPFVRSCIDLSAKSRFDYLDCLIIPRSCDALIRAYYVMKAMNLGPKNIFFFALPRRRVRRNFSWLVDELNEFLHFMEDVTGRRISDETLTQAISAHNKTKMLLRSVNDLRNDAELPFSEMLQIVGSGFWMEKDQYDLLLSEFLRDTSRNTKSETDKVRLFLSGSIVDNLSLVRVIEDCGGEIVDDDLCTGSRWFEGVIDNNTQIFSPIESLASYYLYKPPCSRIGPIKDKVGYMVNKVLNSKSEGVIFNILKWCDVIGWVYPSINDSLKAHEIPTLLLEAQEYHLAAVERLKIRIETFVAMIREGRR